MKKLMVLLVVLALAACSASNENKKTDSPAPETEVVNEKKDSMPEVDMVSSATSKPNEVLFNGTMVVPPQYKATVTLVMGGTVKSTALLSGMAVKKGQVLAVLENPDFIDLQQAYLDSHAQLEYLESEYKRQQVLAQEQVASQKKFQQSKAEYLSMKTREQAAAAQLALLGMPAEELLKNGIQPYMEIKAPLNGYVGNVSVNTGKHIAAGEMLCEIIDKRETLLRLVAYEKDLGHIQVGEVVEFRVNGIGNQPFRGKIIAVGQQVDEVSRSLEVYAKVDSNEAVFRPGMYVTARILKMEQE